MSKEVHDGEKAHVMFKLARKDNWGHKYDRLEHFKRFEHVNVVVKELSKTGWLIVYKKFTGISLNAQHKKEIVECIEKNMPHLKGMVG